MKRFRRRKTTRKAEEKFGRNLGKYIYKNAAGGYIFMRSTWEVKYALFLDSREIKWIYEPFAFRTSKGFYFPDFYLPELNEYHEVKGRLTEEANQKMLDFQKSYPNETLKILRGQDLKDLGIDI